jgi:uncharacterized protein (DUF362 family)
MIRLARVAIVKGSRNIETVFRALNLVDFDEALRSWNKVLVKVNFITTKDWATGATTDPLVVEAIVERLSTLGIEALVVESDATTTNADKACELSGMRAMCDRLGVRFVNLRYDTDRVEIKIPHGMTLSSIRVPKIITESAIISAAKLKTHMDTGVTLGMKNMFGLIPEKMKGVYHLRGMDKVIVDINTFLKSQMTVIDGFVVMEGRGPVHGSPVKMDTIIAGSDPVATDATAARVMSIDPQTIEHIRWAHERGLGDMKNVEIIGDSIEAVKRSFARF